MPWTGIDQSPRQIADCPYRPVIRGDGARLPFRDGSFGSVILLWMLYHLEEPRVALTAWIHPSF